MFIIRYAASRQDRRLCQWGSSLVLSTGNHQVGRWLIIVIVIIINDHIIAIIINDHITVWVQRVRVAPDYLPCLTSDIKLAAVENLPSGVAPSSGPPPLSSCWSPTWFWSHPRRWCCKNWLYPRSLTWYDKVKGKFWCSPKFLLELLFSLGPSYWRGRVYKLKFYLSVCLSVCLYVITSTFPILGLQIIPESC